MPSTRIVSEAEEEGVSDVLFTIEVTSLPFRVNSVLLSVLVVLGKVPTSDPSANIGSLSKPAILNPA